MSSPEPALAAHEESSSLGKSADSHIANTYAEFGAGLSYAIQFDQHWSAGLSTRVHNVGDTSFDFGNSSAGTYRHGFSTSIFYTGFYSELSYSF